MIKKTSMSDIAKELGVSKTTVSRAFNGSNDISESQKGKILAKAKEMNYRFNSSAKSLRTDQQQNVGIIVNDLFTQPGESFYTQIYNQLVKNFKELNYNVLLEIRLEDTLPLFLRENKVDGIIILGQVSKNYLALLNNESLPITLIDQQSENFDSVYTDNFHSSFKITNYLLENGHKEIAFIGNSTASKNIMERFFGYSMALELANLKVNPTFIVNDRDNNNNELELILPNPLPTAFFCNNDKLAFELINLLRTKNIHVPQDVSIVGFDDTIYSRLSRPTITTARVPIDLLAKEGTRLLLEKINHSEDTISNLSLTTKLIKRDSVRDLNLK